jgi:hypothetical protein
MLKLLFEFLQPAKYLLPVLKLATVVQLEPSYSSVAVVRPEGGEPGLPPKAKAAVWIPAPVKPLLAVFKP